MKKVYILSFSGKNGFYKAILESIKFLIDEDKYVLCETFEECNICFMFLQHNKDHDNTLINNYLKYDGDINELKNNAKCFWHINKLMKENTNKYFYMYWRADQSGLPFYCVQYFLDCNNFISLVKDYLSDYFDNEEFLFHCYKLLVNNDNLKEHFDISSFPSIYSNKEIITMKKRISEEYRNKIETFTFSFGQYGPILCNPLRPRITPSRLDEKQYDVFYCKHQRKTVDGIARRHIYQNVMPNLEKKFNVKYSEELNQDDYYNYINKSKIVISPFGLGERVEDDDRCNYYNTIVIKPYPEYDIYNYFNVFTDKNFSKTIENAFPPCIVFCKADFSDIEEVITDILDNYEMYLEKVKLRNKSLENFIKTNKLKDDFNRILDKCEST